MTKVPCLGFLDTFGLPNEGQDKNLCSPTDEVKPSTRLRRKTNDFLTWSLGGQTLNLNRDEFQIPEIHITPELSPLALPDVAEFKFAEDGIHPPVQYNADVIMEDDEIHFSNNFSRDTTPRNGKFGLSQKKLSPTVSRKSSKSSDCLDGEEPSGPKVKFKTPLSKIKFYRTSSESYINRIGLNSPTRKDTISNQDGSPIEKSHIIVPQPFMSQKRLITPGLDFEKEKLHLEMLQSIRTDDCKAFRSLLKKRNVDVNMTYGENGALIHDASYKGCTKCIKALLKAGSYVNLCDDYGWTALHAAVLGLNLEAIKLLLENNALPNQLNSEGLSPCHLAVLTNDLNIIHELIRAGGDPLLKGGEVTPFQMAIDLKKSVALDYFLHMSCLLVES